MSNITFEQAQQLAAAQGKQIIANSDGTYSVVPLGGQPQVQQPTVPTPPAPTASMRLTDYGSAGAGMGNKTVLEAFRACGRAVNGGQDIHHGE